MLNLLTPLLALMGPQGIAIALAVSLLGSASGGAYAMHRWDGYSTLSLQNKVLGEKLATIQKAQENDSKAAQQSAARADALQKKINDIKIINPNRKCFTADESKRLLKLWQ